MFTSSSQKTISKLETCKVITIKISSHLLAIPVNAVFKIIRSSFVYSSLGDNKLVYIDKQALPLIDLYDILKSIKPNNQVENPTETTSSEEKFLVLTKSDKGNLSAFIVDEPPVLMELSLSDTYIIPPHQKQTLQNIASHIALVPDKNNSHITVLLLDINQALLATGFVNDILPS